MVRNMGLEDLEQVADLAQGERIARQGWEPEFWALAPAGRQLHLLRLRSLLSAGQPAIVATCGNQIVGAVVAVEATAGRWLVEDLCHSPQLRWSQLGPPLLSALVARATEAGVGEVLVPCPRADGELAAALRSAGLELVSWTRVGRLSVTRPEPDPGVRLATAADATDVERLLGGQPVVPHGMPAVSSHSEAVVIDEGSGPLGVALLGSVPTAPGYSPGGSGCLVEHRAMPDGDWERLLRGVEFFAGRRGDVQVLVPVSDHDALDAALDALGYGRPLEWWRWRQPQPLVAPHSAQA
jgi:hypothetical protein